MMFRENLLCFSLHPLTLSCHWPLQASVFFALSIQVFTYNVRFPLSFTFSRINLPSCFNLSLQQRCSSPLNILGALPWTLFGMSMFLLYWGTWNCVQHSRNGLTSAKYSTTLDLLAVLCLRSPGYHSPLCESVQAGCRNKHENINKTKRVLLFFLLHQLRTLKTAPRLSSRAVGTVELGPS